MKASTERAKIDQQFSLLELRLNSLFKRLDQYDDDTLITPVREGVWSAMQIMNHLSLSERLSLKYLQKKLSFKPKLALAGVMSRVRFQVLRLYLQSNIKVKAPKGVRSEDMPAICSFAELQSDWRNDRHKLRNFLNDLDDDVLDRELYKHPFVGRLTIAQMLQFFLLHFERHEKQIISRLP
ncbi:MAG: DinB family protein [Saprospiraceae bacterium]|nr:DinB family protein [Saprospiraceae bacterium]